MGLLTCNVKLHDRFQMARLYPIFLKSGSVVKLDFLAIFASSEIMCESEIYHLDKICELISQGTIRTSISNGERLLIPDLLLMEAANVIPIVSEDEFLKEITDIVRELNGQQTTSELCINAYNDYMQNPNEATRLRLKEAYEKTPVHLRCWLLGFDEKDVPIRKAIYGK